MEKTRRGTWLAVGSCVLIGAGTAGFFAVDRAAEGILSRARPSLERTLSGPLGHDVDLGPYEGLRPLGPGGSAIGPSRILPSAGGSF